MRVVIEKQNKLGSTAIADIKFDLSSRDEIPKLLMGLQHIYCTPAIRDEVFQILRGIIPKGINPKTGRSGMELWKILVLGTLRLNCNWDYDKLQENANNHMTLRQMLGHGSFDDKDYHYYYPLQTLKDNIFLLTPEVLEKINTVVIKAGHDLLGKKKLI